MRPKHDRHRSGSPVAWTERRRTYKARSGPVSNPGQPSLNNRYTRRHGPLRGALSPFALAMALVADTTGPSSLPPA